MNTVQLIGRLTKEPEAREGNGHQVAALRLAVNGRDRSAAPDYVDVVAFDGLAKSCTDHLEKGRQVAVAGRLSHSEWEAEDGSRRMAGDRHFPLGAARCLAACGCASPTSRATARFRLSNMAAPLTLTAWYEPVEDGWVQGRVRELPAVITAAPTRTQARAMLEDAVREYLLALLDAPPGDQAPAGVDHEQLAVIIGD